MKITSVEPIHLRVPVVEEIPDGTLDVLVVRKLVRNLPAFVDGRVSVPDGPGLEIELDEEIIREFRVD